MKKLQNFFSTKSWSLSEGGYTCDFPPPAGDATITFETNKQKDSIELSEYSQKEK